MTKTKPAYRAYKPVTMTDGILAWPQDRFDNTVGEWTDGDIDKFQASLGASAPLERIASMRERLDSLKDVTSMIKMHADAIRAIHAGLDNHHSVTKAELEMLAEADRLWEKIIILRDVMPKATTGVAVIAGGKKAKENRALRYEQEKELWRGAAQEILSGRKSKPGKRELARLVERKLDPALNEEEIEKRADSHRNWIDDLL